MPKIWDETIEWPGLHGTGGSFCRVQIFESADRLRVDDRVVILTEPADNKGCSVTNGVERIAERVLYDHNLDLANVTFIEHYEADDRKPVPRFEDTFDMVYMVRNKYGRLSGPSWARLKWPDIAKSIGFEGREWSDL